MVTLYTHKVTLTRLHLQGYTVLTRLHCTHKVMVIYRYALFIYL